MYSIESFGGDSTDDGLDYTTGQSILESSSSSPARFPDGELTNRREKSSNKDSLSRSVSGATLKNDKQDISPTVKKKNEKQTLAQKAIAQKTPPLRRRSGLINVTADLRKSELIDRPPASSRSDRALKTKSSYAGLAGIKEPLVPSTSAIQHRF